MTDSTEMQALRAWLAWATTETHVPAVERAVRAPGDAPVSEAAGYLCDHAGGIGDEPVEATAWCLDHHPIAFRDLVLAWAAAAEAMRAAVPEYVPAVRPPPPADACPACKSRPCEGTHMSCSVDRYLAENPDVQAGVTEHHTLDAQALYEYDEPCSGCGGERCTGTSVHCNANRYLAQNPDRFAAL